MNNKFISKFKYLIPIILVVFLLIPKLALAQLDPASWLDHLTESVEEWATAMNTALIGLFILYIASVGSLLLTAWALQVSIENQGPWMASLTSMTEPAWNFTVGLANLLLVFILLIIAFGFILKIETIQARKTLPKLVIVALLMNFSLVFVRGLFDISNIIYNTILSVGGGSFIDTALTPFFNNLAVDISVFIGTWMLILVSQSTPIIHPFAQIAFTTVLFPLIFLPNIIIWVFQIFAFFGLSSLFLLYAFLFLARVFVVQILAILSPIAFLALILPQTRVHWNDWFKHLTSWLLLGVFLLFFLVVGFKGMVYLIPTLLGAPLTTPLPLISWFSLFEYIFYYFAIFVYLGVILFISKKYLPELVEVLIGLGQQAAGFIMTKGLKPFGRAAEIETRQSLAKWEGAREWGEKHAYAPKPETKNPLKTLGWAVGREIGKAVGPSTQEFLLKKTHEYEQKYRGKSAKMQAVAMMSAPYDYMRTGIVKATAQDENYEEMLAESKDENGKKYESVNKLLEDLKDEGKRTKIYEQFHLDGAYKVADYMQERGIIRAIMPDIAAKYKLRELYGEKPSYSENERKEAMGQVISAIKPEQFAVMPITVLFMPEIMEELVKQINNVPHFIAFVQRHRQTGVTEYENTVTKLATNENIPPSAYLQKHNPKIFDFITSSYGQGYVSLRNMNKEFYKQTLGIEELKDKLAAFSENLEELNRILESKEATPSEKSDASKKIPLVGDKIDILKDALKEKGGE